MSSRNNLKYYFTASTKELEQDKDGYRSVINHLNLLGCIPLNYVHFEEDNKVRKEYEKQLSSGKISVYDLQTSIINQADILVADITKESITVGYQIEYAIRKKIPVLALVKDKINYHAPVMLTSNHYGLLILKKYNNDLDLKRHISEFVGNVVTEKIKFNFFISIPVNNYISKRAENENKTKSQVIREILLQEADRNPVP